MVYGTNGDPQLSNVQKAKKKKNWNYSVLNKMASSNSSPQASREPVEEDVEIVQESEQMEMIPRK